MIVLNYEEYILSLHGFVYACACIVCVCGMAREKRKKVSHFMWLLPIQEPLTDVNLNSKHQGLTLKTQILS